MNKFEITLGGKSHFCAPLTVRETLRATRIIEAQAKNTTDLQAQSKSLVEISEILAAALRRGGSPLDSDKLQDIAAPFELIAAIGLLVRRSYGADAAIGVN